MKRTVIAKIVNTNGVRGAVKCLHYCDSVRDLENYGEFYLESGRKLTVERMSFQKNTAIIKFRGVDSANDGLLIKNELLYIDKESMPKLPKGVYYISDLMGLTVLTLPDGRELGRITEVLQTGANDVYVVDKKGDEGLKKKQYLIPAIPDVIDSVDIEGGVMRITPIAGLLDDED
ncbi:MAG: 16S rRNA processing protein RimM [Clostridia bacterium]|nr:16S rRNA processing protein RimM [Clostridia bacterium]